MKGILLCIFSTFIFVNISAQDKQKDSLASEIVSLEKLKSEITSRVDVLSNQLTELFSVQQSIKNRIQEIDEEMVHGKSELERLRTKKELTVSEKRRLEAIKKAKSDRNKLAKSIAEHDVQFNKQLALLDETVGMRNELDEKIQQLKAQYGTL
jgi:chromosome segregation ATPase